MLAKETFKSLIISKSLETNSELNKAIKHTITSPRVTPEILSQLENQVYIIDEMNLNLVNYM